MKNSTLLTLLLLSAPLLPGCRLEDWFDTTPPSAGDAQSDDGTGDCEDVPAELDCLARVHQACETLGCDRDTYASLADDECGMPTAPEPPLPPAEEDCAAALRQRCYEAGTDDMTCARIIAESCTPVAPAPPSDEDCVGAVLRSCADEGRDEASCHAEILQRCFGEAPPETPAAEDAQA